MRTIIFYVSISPDFGVTAHPSPERLPVGAADGDEGFWIVDGLGEQEPRAAVAARCQH